MFRYFSILILLLFIYAKANGQLSRKTYLSRIDSAYTSASALSKDSLRCEMYYRLAWKYKMHNQSLALQYAHHALQIADSSGLQILKAICLDAIGVIYQIKTNYDKALLYHLQALRIYRTFTGNNIDKAGCLGNIAVLYVATHKYHTAKRYVLELLNLGIEHKHLIIAYSNMGVIEDHLGNIEESVKWYKKAIIAGTKHNDKRESIPALINLAEYNVKKGQYNLATYYCNEALKANTSNDAYYQAETYLILGKAEQLKRHYAQAVKYLSKAKQLAEAKGLNLSLIKIYEQLASIHEENNNNISQAFFYFKKHTQLKDSSLNIVTTRQIAEIQEKYEAEKKDKEIVRLNNIRQVTEEREEREKITRNFFVAAFFFILFLSIILIRNVVLKQRINKVLFDKNEELNTINIALTESKAFIESQNKQIEKINAELNTFNIQLINENTQTKYEVLRSKVNPHFLFNSLSTLSSIVIHDQDMALDYIGRFAELYRMILDTGEQQLISLEKEMMIVEHYLYLQKMRFNDSLIIEIDVPAKDSLLYLPPFSLQMSVENAIKHNSISNKSPLYISVYTDEGFIVLSNNLQKNTQEIASTATGQKSIFDRYKAFTSKQPDFIKTQTEYIVKLPLIPLLKEVVI